MATFNVMELLRVASRELIEGSRSAACDPEAVRELARGAFLPTSHHAHGCLACQHDALRLREQMENRRPSVPLSLILRGQDDVLRGAAGLQVSFSDHTTARLRLEGTVPGEARLCVDQLQVTGGMSLLRLTLESRREGQPLSERCEHHFTEDRQGGYVLTVPWRDLDDPRNYLLLRLWKEADELDEVRPHLVPLRRAPQEMAQLAASSSTSKSFLLEGQEYSLRLEVSDHPTRPGVKQLRFIGQVPPGKIELYLNHQQLLMDEPFEDGFGRVSAQKLQPFLEGKEELEIGVKPLDEVVAAFDRAIQVRERMIELIGGVDSAVRDHPTVVRDLARVYRERGNARRANQTFTEAVCDYDQALEILSRLIDKSGGLVAAPAALIEEQDDVIARRNEAVRAKL